MEIKQTTELSQYLAQLVVQIGSTPVCEDDRREVRQHLLDAIAAGFIGCRKAAFDGLRSAGGIGASKSLSHGEAPQPMGTLDAGMLWAFAINGSVFEDGSREGACHPAAAVVPAVLVLADDKEWELIDRAVIAGYDVMVRMARCGNPQFTRKGFHPTSITAPFGAAAAASVLLGLDLDQTQNALCLAAMGGAGLMSSFKNGETQPLQVAWAVRSGIFAALMAEAGHCGYSRILEEGFYPAYLGSDPAVSVDAPLGRHYAIRGCYLKPYPGCRHLHPSIDAFDAILRETGLGPDQIDNVIVRTYRAAVETEIETLGCRGDAYFNIPYALAARAVLGRNDYDAFDERHFSNREITEVMKRVQVSADEHLESLYPEQRGAIVELRTRDGRAFTQWINHPRGEPENPLSLSITREKFRVAAKTFLTVRELDVVESLLDVPGPVDEVLSSLTALTGAQTFA